MNSSEEMATMSQILEKLRLKKKDTEFRMTEGGFSSGKKVYQPEDLKIIRTYRFEGDSNPSDSSTIYLIEAKDGQCGYSIDAYGAYSNHDADGYDEFLRKIPVEDREHLEW